MKPDLYTKAVLTVIAACLLVLAGRDLQLVPAATAAVKPAATQTYGLVPVNADGSITVRLQTQEAMPVNIIGIQRPFTSDNVARYSWDAVVTANK